jgi:cyclic pyranopterin phosphate synthase
VLKSSGLTGATFHLDTLRHERYAAVMGPGDAKKVFKALEKAASLGFYVKINVVVQKGINDDEIWDFLLFSKEIGIEVRFIELMDTGSAKDFVKKAFITGEEILNIIRHYTPVRPMCRQNPQTPAEQFRAEEIGIIFGLIASDTRPFCNQCNRLRLSASGSLRTCLYEPQGQKLDLSQSTDALFRQMHALASGKESFHPLVQKNKEAFSMSNIGG